jgi:UDP-N-acetylmuramoylalanine--D-glutamate ligase
LRPGFDLAGKRVLVVGLARTGVAVSLFAAGYGATVTATDEKPEGALAETAARLRAAGVKLELGRHPSSAFFEQDLIVVSPGVPVNLPPLVLAHVGGIPVWGEIELAWRFLRGKVVAITGSNGKTTTTSLVAHILEIAGIPTLVGGNIGAPLISLVESSTDSTVTVAEISSFQLETIEAFRPEIGVLLNLTPDHLDRHASFEEYAGAKMRLFENQLERDFAILNADDPQVTKRMPSRSHVFWFSRQKRVAEGAFLLDDQIIFRLEGSEIVVGRRSEIPLRGEHNVENVLAACAAAYLAGAEPAAIARGVKTFRGVEHRLEFAGEVGGVKYYNDSKATNVDAALKAIEAFPGPLVVILGGKDKGSPYTPLRDALRARGRIALLIGEAAEKIATDLGDAVSCVHAGTLERAIELAADRVRPGDVVLLAPACSSFDQFENYEHRGRTFKQLVAKLGNGSVAPAAVHKG